MSICCWDSLERSSLSCWSCNFLTFSLQTLSSSTRPLSFCWNCSSLDSFSSYFPYSFYFISSSLILFSKSNFSCCWSLNFSSKVSSLLTPYACPSFFFISEMSLLYLSIWFLAFFNWLSLTLIWWLASVFTTCCSLFSLAYFFVLALSRVISKTWFSSFIFFVNF